MVAVKQRRLLRHNASKIFPSARSAITEESLTQISSPTPLHEGWEIFYIPYQLRIASCS